MAAGRGPLGAQEQAVNKVVAQPALPEACNAWRGI